MRFGQRRALPSEVAAVEAVAVVVEVRTRAKRWIVSSATVIVMAIHSPIRVMRWRLEYGSWKGKLR